MPETCLTAKARFDAAKAKIDKLSRAIGFVARVLEVDPLSLKVSVSDPCPPIAAQPPGDYCFEHGNWPRAETIAEALNEYREARIRLANSGKDPSA